MFLFNRPIRILATCGMVVAGSSFLAASSQAQTTGTSAATSVATSAQSATSPQVQIPGHETVAPAFTLLDVPVGITAPVSAPYSNSAYSNFAGQPQTGNSVLSDAMTGQ